VVWDDEGQQRGDSDGLRRSPSGRVPQWVRDEAAGRPLTDTRWRAWSAPATTTLPAGSTRRGRQGRAWAWGIAVAVAVLGARLSTVVDLPWAVTLDG
jgi:hypothetical protein